MKAPLVFIGLLYLYGSLYSVVFNGLLYSQFMVLQPLYPSACNMLDTDVCRRDV